MFSSRSLSLTRLLAVLIGLLALAPSSVQSGEEETVPRYRLKVGQELIYRSRYEFHFGSGSSAGTHQVKVDWQVWVVRKNDDGSWRLVLRNSQVFASARGSAKPTTERPANVYMGYCDLFDDGRLGRESELGYRLKPQTLFPRLPADILTDDRGWEDFNRRDDTRARFTRVKKEKDAAGLWVFDEVRESPLDAIYLSTFKTRYFFDTKRGLIARSESENTQGYGFNGKGTETLELQGIKEQDEAWMKRFAEEAEYYFAANKAYEELTSKVTKRFKDAAALLDEAEKTLKDARDKLTVPILREQADQQIEDHANTARYRKEEAQRLAEVVGKPAPDWEVKDLDGKDHALKDYRGKVVILDFWYRGCGWCIRAMPQVAQMAEDFKNEPVVVFGMNTDREEKNARFVVDKMKIRYPVLKAEGLPKKYKVSGFPTLIIIDPKGNVHDVHVGYSPTLRQEVSASVRQLLAKK
ncbi:MAG TPA: TlpA disulfide reductase family protein [Gemmataceae bacterium]|jgi:peroxiredoxin